MIFENQRRFSRTTKRRLKEQKGFTCEKCGQKFNPSQLEIHHNHIWRSEAKRYEIPGRFVACDNNGKVLCENCHDQMHEDNAVRPISLVIAGIKTIAEETNQKEKASQVIAQISSRHRE